MKKILIKNIEIQYDDELEDRIEDIKNIISNNYELFLLMLGDKKVISLVPTTSDETLYIPDFYEFFYEFVKQVFCTQDNNNLIEIMPTLYIEHLIRKFDNKPIPFFEANENLKDEILNSLIAYIYFIKTSSFEDFVNYLKDKKDSDKIFDWLKEQVRFDTYNYLLEITIDCLKEIDPRFLENITGINNMMSKDLLDSENRTSNTLSQVSSSDKSINAEETKIHIPAITFEELDNLFYEFLKFINAPESWRQTYNELKEYGRITFDYQENGLNNSCCYKDQNSVFKILISDDGTIKTFFSLVHEFIHYVSTNNSLTFEQFHISEFPSIFFEKISALFLKNNGYEENVIDMLLKERDRSNRKIYDGVIFLFSDILRFANKGKISKNDKVELLQSMIESIYNTRKQMAEIYRQYGVELEEDFFKMPEIDIYKEVDSECDSLTETFITDGLLVVDGYQYLLDTRLADEVIKKFQNDPSVLLRMINIVDNLSIMNLETILKEFEIEQLFEFPDENIKTYGKS